MRLRTMAALLAILTITPAFAAAQHAAIPRLTITNDDKGIVPLRLESLEIHVLLRGHLARTTYELTYRNATGRELDGDFAFPLPPDAEISDLGLYFGNRLRHAVPVERVLARSIYETTVHRRVDPALAEWSASSRAFHFRVYPIPANGVKVVHIAYDQELTANPYELDLRYGATLANVELTIESDSRIEADDLPLARSGDRWSMRRAQYRLPWGDPRGAGQTRDSDRGAIGGRELVRVRGGQCAFDGTRRRTGHAHDDSLRCIRERRAARRREAARVPPAIAGVAKCEVDQRRAVSPFGRCGVTHGRQRLRADAVRDPRGRRNESRCAARSAAGNRRVAAGRIADRARVRRYQLRRRLGPARARGPAGCETASSADDRQCFAVRRRPFSRRPRSGHGRLVSRPHSHRSSCGRRGEHAQAGVADGAGVDAADPRRAAGVGSDHERRIDHRQGAIARRHRRVSDHHRKRAS